MHSRGGVAGWHHNVSGFNMAFGMCGAGLGVWLLVCRLLSPQHRQEQLVYTCAALLTQLCLDCAS
jgi:hypothetical protein